MNDFTNEAHGMVKQLLLDIAKLAIKHNLTPKETTNSLGIVFAAINHEFKVE